MMKPPCKQYSFIHLILINLTTNKKPNQKKNKVNKKLILSQTQKVGSNSRICLWNRKLNDAGFQSGTPIKIEAINGVIKITKDPNAKRKVSKVINHGNELPVIDLKTTKALPLAEMFSQGDKVSVKVASGIIKIRKGGE